MSFLADYLHWTSGTECPKQYRIWAGLSILGHVMGKRFWLMHGRFTIHAPLYVAMVGEAGSGKSTAKNDAKAIYKQLFPADNVSASFQSHQDIVDTMANCPQRIWDKVLPDGNVKPMGYSPFYIICNELSSILSTDKKGMVEFLVDIYDESEFSTGYKGQRRENPERKQTVDNPCISMLACAVPKWFMGNLKLDLFDGGLGRRLIIVYDTKTECVPFPTHVTGGPEAYQAVINHILAMADSQGEIKRTPAAMEWWDTWYRKHKQRVNIDPILSQFDQTKAVQALKVASILSMCERPFKMEVDVPHLQMAVRLLDDLEPNIIRLTSGIGRNELAGVGAQIIDFIDRLGGAVPKVTLLKAFRRYAQDPEFDGMLNSFMRTDEIFILRVPWDGIDRDIVMLEKYFVDYMSRKHPNHPDFTAYLLRKGKH